MPDDKRPGPAAQDPESRIWESLDDGDELDDAVIAADDTGMLSNEAAITIVEERERPGP